MYREHPDFLVSYKVSLDNLSNPNFIIKTVINCTMAANCLQYITAKDFALLIAVMKVELQL